MKFWEKFQSWQEAEKAWDARAEEAANTHPLKLVRHIPKIPGIAPKTARGLRWKALNYLIRNDERRLFLRFFFKHPIRYALRLIRSYFQKQTYLRDGDFFLYGIPSEEAFSFLLEDPKTVLAVGFSYCHKPLECPSGRFNDICAHIDNHPVCSQCFIGKAVHAVPFEPLIIPTIHDIGEKMFSLVEKNPGKRVIFLITACELTLEMFADWGNMLGIQGIGVRLDGRICNTMEAFELSERGIKPGLTMLLPETEKRVFNLLQKAAGKV